ncbi:riboflavin kinase [Microbacterium sp. LWO12-1.2]|uniref:riboflavin kinase n=1 Tax=Microbacterium sp. LWO12-1.2 TaxID=3135261 RepID=UPI00341659FA
MTAAAFDVLQGVVVRGDGRGRELGFPTANLALDSGVPPVDGIYAAWVRVGDDPRRCAASVSIGANPTFPGRRERRVEVHLHDAAGDLYGRRLVVQLIAHLRPTLRFDGVEALIAQTIEDVALSAALLAEDAARV